VTSYLQRRGLDADQISGDLSQAAREDAMRRMKNGSLRFLVATDVAARGIDISDLSHVISYAAPESPEMYVHRTGRTGRVGKAGVAISMISGLDIGNFRQLQNVNRIEIQERTIPSNEEMQARMRERLEVKVEREMRALPDTDRRDQVDRWIPIVETLTATSEGKRDLAAVCAAYLREHRPETTVREDDSAAPSADAAPRGADGGQPGSAAGPGRRRKRRPRRRESGRSH
jgi:ATP-dependent RNA helicase DeaD